MKKISALLLSAALLFPAFATGFANPNDPTDPNYTGGGSSATIDGVEFLSSDEAFKVTVNPDNLKTSSNVVSIPFSIEALSDDTTVDSVTTIDETGKTIDAIGNLITNYHTGLSKTDEYTIELTVNGTDTVEIELDYYHLNSPGSKFLTEYEDGKNSAFGKDVELEFPKDSFLVSTTDVNVAPNQELLFEVKSKPQTESDLVFISNVYRISDGNDLVNATKPSKPGVLRLAYDGDLPSSVAKYNVSISKLVNGDWVPMGGTVKSSSNTVEAPISEFGTYAVTLNYKTFGLPEKSWYYNYMTGLSYKGVLNPGDGGLPNTTTSDVVTVVTADMSRQDFVSALSKGLGLAPVEYTSNFADVVVDFPNTVIPLDKYSDTTSSDVVDIDISKIPNVTDLTFKVGGNIEIEVTNNLSIAASSLLQSSIQSIKSLDAQAVSIVGNVITIDPGPNNTLSKEDSLVLGAVVQMGTVGANGSLAPGTETSYNYDVLGYLQAAINNGLVQGVGSLGGANLLNPGGNLTREQAAVFIARATKLKVNDQSNVAKINRTLEKNFATDWTDISSWARPYVEAAVKAGYITGTVAGEKFEPQLPLTVNQAAALIFRAMEDQKLFGK